MTLFRPWAERTAAASGGTLTFDVRDGFAVANFRNVLDRVMNDVVQVGWGMQGLFGKQFPLTEVATFPFQADDTETGSVALWRLYASGALGDEYNELHPLALGVYPQNSVHYTKKPATLENWNGLKLRAASTPQGDWIAALGGTPISLPAEDLFAAMQRGTIDATLQGWTTFGSIKLADVTSFHLDIGFGTSTIMVFMTKKKFDSLPAQVRKAIDENAGEKFSRFWGQNYDERAARLRKDVLAMPGHERAVLTPAQLDSWRKRVQPVEDEWVKTTPNGAALLAKYRALVAEVKAGK